MKLKAKMKENIVYVKCNIHHEMLSFSMAKKRTGDQENANFITQCTASVNGKVVFQANMSQYLSINPTIKYQFRSDMFKKGDILSMTWIDRKGNTKTQHTKIK